MKIENLKVNGFGKLENKEINFSNGINVIQGNNEAGKRWTVPLWEITFMI